MKIRKLTLAKAELQKLSDAERTFLLISGHIQNEFVSLNKVFAWCIAPRQTDSRVESIVAGSQALIFAKILAGKLHEGWQLLNKAFFGTKLSHDLDGLMHASTKDSLSRLKAYFGRSNLIYTVRNSFSFHYSADEIARHWEEAANEPGFDFFVGNEYGNTFHQASEMAVSLALLNGINPNDRAAALGAFLDEIQKITSLFNDFLSGAMLTILERCGGENLSNLGTEEELFPTRSFEDIDIPFFYLPPQW